ncbi:MAG: DUF814 domain-containing protein [Chlorobiaceae bacterium]|nr:DUF814 domain-containing protein [Chlorobiaceae bacterium]
MHRNYFTLYQAALELNERLAGATVTGICSQEKNQLILTFETADHHLFRLFVITATPRLSIFVKEGPESKTRQSAILMTEACGKSVSGIEISTYDREITIHLPDETAIILQLFGQKSNVFLVHNDVITDAFKAKSSHIGQLYPQNLSGEHILKKLESLALDKTLFISRLNENRTDDIVETICTFLPGFDPKLSKELLRRAGTNRDPSAIFEAFRTIFYELLDPLATVEEKENGEPAFTITAVTGSNSHTFDSVLEGLSFYSISMLKFLDTKEELKSFRTRQLQLLRKKTKELESYNPGMLEEFIRNYETCGHLLMAYLGNEGKGRKSITLQNILEKEAPDITIALKEALSLRQNAEEYFSKAAKTRGKLITMQERHLVLEQEKKAVERLLNEMESIGSPKEARKFHEEHGTSKPGKTQSGRNKHEQGLPFRTVRLSPEVTLLVGKNAENNELLTFEFSKPDDIWLHARGASGSHCVLKGAGMNHLDLIKKAAAIAAWYSAAKHSKLVPVIYTQKKFVRRSKKLQTGQVIVEREKVLFVKPSRESEH